MFFQYVSTILSRTVETFCRGMCLQTATLVPKNQEIKAVLCFCHGYTDNASFVKQIEYGRFVRHGIAVVTIEYEGHGRSDGELGLIYDWDRLVDDTSSLFQRSIREEVSRCVRTVIISF